MQHIEGGAGFSIPPEWSLITSVRYGRMTHFSRMIDKSAHFPQMTDKSAHFPRMIGKSVRGCPLFCAHHCTKAIIQIVQEPAKLIRPLPIDELKWY